MLLCKSSPSLRSRDPHQSLNSSASFHPSTLNLYKNRLYFLNIYTERGGAACSGGVLLPFQVAVRNHADVQDRSVSCPLNVFTRLCGTGSDVFHQHHLKRSRCCHGDGF